MENKIQTNPKLFSKKIFQVKTKNEKHPKDQRFIEEVNALVSSGHVKNVRQLLLSIGANPALYNRILIGRQSVQDYMIDKAAQIYPTFDKTYVYTGEGKSAEPTSPIIDLSGSSGRTDIGTIGARFADFRDNLHKTQEEMARDLGVSRHVISKVENNAHSISAELLARMTAVFNMNANWLLTGQGNMFNRGEVRMLGEWEAQEVVYLPQLDPKAIASFCENITKPLYKLETGKTAAVVKQPGQDYEKAFVLEIEGDSMYPTYRPGTKVIVRLVAENQWGYVTGIHAFSLRNGMFTIKRVIRNQSNLLTLKADNPQRPDELTIQLADILCMFKIGESVYVPAE